MWTVLPFLTPRYLIVLFRPHSPRCTVHCDVDPSAPSVWCHSSAHAPCGGTFTRFRSANCISSSTVVPSIAATATGGRPSTDTSMYSCPGTGTGSLLTFPGAAADSWQGTGGLCVCSICCPGTARADRRAASGDDFCAVVLGAPTGAAWSSAPAHGLPGLVVLASILAVVSGVALGTWQGAALRCSHGAVWSGAVRAVACLRGTSTLSQSLMLFSAVK